MRVKKTIQERVYPTTPSPRGVLQLSTNDHIMPPYYVSQLFFFKERPPHEAFILLKASLAEALTLFYPCAGRYKSCVNGKLEILCNDEGVVLHETWVDCNYDDFLPNFDPHPDFPLFVPTIEPSAKISEIPPFLGQITHFECERICIGIQLHHSLCDGLSISHFLSSWAMLTKSKVNANLEKEYFKPNIVQPFFDRCLLKPNPLPSLISNHPEYQIETQIMPSVWPPCISKILAFTPSYIDALREKARSGLTPLYTRFETLTAHLWRGMILVKGLAPHQDIRLGMAIDGRKRFNPPLPEGYFGNVVFLGYIATTAGEVVENPLSFVAHLVKDAIMKVSDAHMRSALDWVAMHESSKLVHLGYFRPSIDVCIISWTRFPLYDLDFGWGKPSFVRIPISLFDGTIFLLPSPLGEGHVDAFVGLCEEHMPKLEEYIKDALKEN